MHRVRKEKGEVSYPRCGREGGSLPAGFEGGGGERGELGCDGEDAVEFAVGSGWRYGGRDACEDSCASVNNHCCPILIASTSWRWVPRLAQANVCNAILVAKGDVEVTVSIKGATVEANILLERLEEKGALIDGGFSFARHSLDVDRASWHRAVMHG